MGKTALYRHYDDNDDLLYVGITSDLNHRFKSHERNSKWWVFTVRHTVEWFDSCKDAAIAEISAIKAESPEFNISHNLTSNPVGDIILTIDEGDVMPGKNQCLINNQHLVDLASDKGLRGLPLSVYLFMISKVEKDKVCRVPQVLIADEFDASPQYLSKIMKILKDKNLLTEIKEIGLLKTYRLTSEYIIVQEEPPAIPVAAKPKKSTVVLPDFLDTELWNDFLEHRKKLKAPNTARALNSLLKKLSGFHNDGHDVNAIIQESYDNGWKGVFEPKKNNGVKSSLMSKNTSNAQSWIDSKRLN